MLSPTNRDYQYVVRILCTFPALNTLRLRAYGPQGAMSFVRSSMPLAMGLWRSCLPCPSMLSQLTPSAFLRPVLGRVMLKQSYSTWKLPSASRLSTILGHSYYGSHNSSSTPLVSNRVIRRFRSDDSLLSYHPPLPPTQPAPPAQPLNIIDLDALKSQPLSVLVVKESTAPLQMQMTKQELTQQCKISARDLRAIDPTFRRQLSSILPRSSCIIVNLGPIKSIIMFDRVLLFEPNSIHIKQLLPLLQSRLSPNAPISASLSPQSATSNGTLPPFELRALEVLLIHTCHHFDSALARLMPEIDYVLDALYTQSSSSLSSSLQRLLPLKKALSNFIASVDESNHAVSAVLDSDEDMAEMYITTKQMLGHRRRIDQHQEVEVLLETYHAQLMEVQHRASQVKVTIQSTQDILNIHLADVRNELMRFNLLLTSGAFAIACGSIISGIFGMNLLSTFEDSRYAFAIVSGSIALVSSTVFFTALRYCLKKKIL